MLDLPQPHKEYEPGLERVRNSRIKLAIERKIDIESFGVYLRADPAWPFGADVGFGIDGGNAASVYTDYIDGGNA